MATVTEEDKSEVKQEVIFLECRKEWCEDNPLEELTFKSATVNVKTEQAEQEAAITSVVSDIDMSSVINTTERVEIKDESAFSVYDDNITIEECCIEQQIESRKNLLMNKLYREKQTAEEEILLGAEGDESDDNVKAVQSPRLRVRLDIHTDTTSTLTPHTPTTNDGTATFVNSPNVESYICAECSKCFNKKDLLISHICKHSNDYKYRASMRCCNKQDTVAVQDSCVHEKKKRWRCDICINSFGAKSKFIEHRRIHTGEKPFKCDVCMKRFSQKGTCKRHSLIHTGKKYKCDVCSKCFSIKDSLKRHLRIHTGDKPYKCDVCKKCFTDKSSYNKHNMRIHIVNKL